MQNYKVWTQVVLPLVLFVGVVAGVTYLKNQTPEQTTSLGVAPGKEPLTFRERTITWDPERPDYVGEFELTQGHHNFWVENRSGEPAEIALKYQSCTCTSVGLCLVPPEQVKAVQQAKEFHDQLQARAALPGAPGQAGLLHLINLAAGGSDGYGGLAGQRLIWQILKQGEAGHPDPGQPVPADHAGLVRLTWNGDKRRVGPLRLRVTLQTAAQGRPVNLEAVVAFVDPVQVFPKSLAVTDWDGRGVARMEFRCWSATRVHFPLKAKDPLMDGLVEAEPLPLSGSECRALERELAQADGPPTQVLSGYKVKLTINQEKGEKQLEQGFFQRWIALDSSAAPELAKVQISGAIRGDVIRRYEKGKEDLDLGDFRRSDPVAKGSITLSAGPDVRFLPDKIEKIPDYLQVALTQTNTELNQWRLTAKVDPSKVDIWPEDSAIILHVLKGKQARRIRIPVRANMFQ